jgi:hypothetical protein
LVLVHHGLELDDLRPGRRGQQEESDKRQGEQRGSGESFQIHNLLHLSHGYLHRIMAKSSL